MKINRKLFEQSIIAQDDDQDYSESGYVACVIEDRAYLFHYSHCSCFGTWEAISNYDDGYWDNTPEDREISAAWEGSVKDLIYLAATKADPAMPERESTPEDYDHDHLMAVYDQILTHYKAKEQIMNSNTENNQKQTWKLTEKEVYCIYIALKSLPPIDVHLNEDFKDIDTLQQRMYQGCKSYIENKKSQMPK